MNPLNRPNVKLVSSNASVKKRQTLQKFQRRGGEEGRKTELGKEDDVAPNKK